MEIERMREWARKSPCKVIKFAASGGELICHNGEFYADCKDCKRVDIEQSYPECRANHAEWGVLAKRSPKELYVYCMTPDGKDYPFKRFWCQICAILIPLFGVEKVYLWDDGWVSHDPKRLIEEVASQ